MKQYNLGFISDQDLYGHVKHTVEAYRREIDLEQFNQNIIDPIKLTFHQNICCNSGHGWTFSEKWFDIENPERHIFIILNIKHLLKNTAFSRTTYIKMQSKILEDKEATCYLADISSIFSKDEIWNFPMGNKFISNKRIRRVSIDKLYEMVFHDPNAYHKLGVVLPQVIKDVLADNPNLAISNSEYGKLTEKTTDILTGLCLLAFSPY